MPIRTVADLPRNEPGLVDKYIGTAYDVVLAVYNDLPTINAVGEVAKEILAAQAEIEGYLTQAQQYANTAQTSASEAAASAKAAADSASGIQSAIDTANNASQTATDAAAKAESAYDDAVNAATTIADKALDAANAATAQAQQVADDLATEVKNRADAITGEAEARAAAIAAEAAQRQTVADQLAQETTNRSEAIQAEATARAAAIAQEAQSRSTADAQIQSQVTQVSAATNTNAAAIQQETEARTSSVSALANQVTTMVSQNAKTVAYLIRASGWGATSQPSGFVDGVTDINGKNVMSGGSTWNLIRITSAGVIDISKTYSLISDASQAATLASDINNSPAGSTLIVYTANEAQANVSADLISALQGIGAGGYYLNNLKYRSAYILVGVAGAGKGNGIEKYAGSINTDPNAWVEYTLQLVNNKPVGIEGTAFSQAIVDQEASARVSGDTANADLISSLTSVVNNNSSAITTESQTRANADSALAERTTTLEANVAQDSSKITDLESVTNTQAQSLQTLQTDVGNNSNQISDLKTTTQNQADEISTLNSTTGNLTSAVQTEQTARSNADSALGQRIDTIVAQNGITEAYIVKSAGTDVQGAPDGFASGIFNPDGTVVFQGAHAWNMIVFDETGSIILNKSYDTVNDSAAASALSGDIFAITKGRAAIIYTNGDPKTGYTQDITNGLWYLGGSSTVGPSLTTGSAYILAGIAGSRTLGGSEHSSSNASANWVTYTAQLIKGNLVGLDGSLNYVQSQITQESTARVSGDQANADKITSLSSTVNSNTAAIASESQTRADGDSALSSRMDTLSATVGTQSSDIENLQTATQNQAQNLTTLNARAIVNPNLILNPTFQNMTHWTAAAGVAPLTNGFLSGLGCLYFNANQISSSSPIFITSDMVPVTVGTQYCASVDQDSSVDANTSVGSVVYIAWHDADGNWLSNSDWSLSRGPGLFDATGQDRYKYYSTGIAPAKTAYAVLVIQWNNVENVSQYGAARAKLEAGSVPTLFSLDSSVTAANANITNLQTVQADHTEELNSLSATSGANSSNISTLQTVQAQQTAQYTVLNSQVQGNVSSINNLNQTQSGMAQSINNLSLRTAAKQNILKNSTLATMDGWGATDSSLVANTGSNWWGPALFVAHSPGINPPDGTYQAFTNVQDGVNVEGGRSYVLSGDMCLAADSGSIMRCFIGWWDVNQKFISNSNWSASRAPAIFDGTGQDRFQYYATGVAPANAVYATVCFRADNVTNMTQFGVSRPKLEAGTYPTAFTDTSSAITAVETATALGASYSLTARLDSDGQIVTAGMQLGVGSANGKTQSYINFNSDTFRISNNNGGNSIPFQVVNGVVQINNAVIGTASIGNAQIADGAITNAKISGIFASANGNAQINWSTGDASFKNVYIDGELTAASVTGGLQKQVIVSQKNLSLGGGGTGYGEGVLLAAPTRAGNYHTPLIQLALHVINGGNSPSSPVSWINIQVQGSTDNVNFTTLDEIDFQLSPAFKGTVPFIIADSPTNVAKYYRVVVAYSNGLATLTAITGVITGIL